MRGTSTVEPHVSVSGAPAVRADDLPQPASGAGSIDDLSRRLVAARESVGWTQGDVAIALGVARQMISYWEKGARSPKHHYLLALARVYGVDAGQLTGHTERQGPGDGGVDDSGDEGPVVDAVRMLFRRSSVDLDEGARTGLGQFVNFLDYYSDLAGKAGRQVTGMTASPFVPGPGFGEFDVDARRKAGEVRSYLGLGQGPIADVDTVCATLGVTVCRAHLGCDLNSTISGAFYKHPSIGFTIVINLDMTQGRRRFTVAHELAHALLHSGTDGIIVSDSGARGDAKERFADLFAGEFLMPEEGIRRALEALGYGPKVNDVEPVIHLQRMFNVSYITALVRLRQANIINTAVLERLRKISPMSAAEALGYETNDAERPLDPGKSVTARYPLRFRTLLRECVERGLTGESVARRRLDLTRKQFMQLVDVGDSNASSLDEREWDEFAALVSLT